MGWTGILKISYCAPNDDFRCGSASAPLALFQFIDSPNEREIAGLAPYVIKEIARPAAWPLARQGGYPGGGCVFETRGVPHGNFLRHLFIRRVQPSAP